MNPKFIKIECSRRLDKRLIRLEYQCLNAHINCPINFLWLDLSRAVCTANLNLSINVSINKSVQQIENLSFFDKTFTDLSMVCTTVNSRVIHLTATSNVGINPQGKRSKNIFISFGYLRRYRYSKHCSSLWKDHQRSRITIFVFRSGKSSAL